jgi:hypothetical protein
VRRFANALRRVTTREAGLNALRMTPTVAHTAGFIGACPSLSRHRR